MFYIIFVIGDISYLYFYVISRVKSASDTTTFEIHRYAYDQYYTNLKCVMQCRVRGLFKIVFNSLRTKYLVL
jgi:hypothetical protein